MTYIAIILNLIALGSVLLAMLVIVKAIKRAHFTKREIIVSFIVMAGFLNLFYLLTFGWLKP